MLPRELVRRVRRAGARDAAMIGIWYACGIRRTELARLNLADFDPTLGKLTIQRSEGRKARTVCG